MPAIWLYRFNLVTPKHRLREPDEQPRALPECRLGRWRGRQVHRLGVGAMGTTRRRGREGTDRWFVSQHSLPAQRERDSQRKGCGPRSPRFDIRAAHRVRIAEWVAVPDDAV